MLVLLANDDSGLRQTIGAALVGAGHDVYDLDTSNAQLLTVQLGDFAGSGRQPDLVILDGHNILRDAEGQKLIDLTPLVLITWLRQNEISRQARFVLYSSDEKLLETARRNRHLQVWRAVSKQAAEGGMAALLEVVEELDRQLRTRSF